MKLYKNGKPVIRLWKHPRWGVIQLCKNEKGDLFFKVKSSPTWFEACYQPLETRKAMEKAAKANGRNSK